MVRPLFDTRFTIAGKLPMALPGQSFMEEGPETFICLVAFLPHLFSQARHLFQTEQEIEQKKSLPASIHHLCSFYGSQTHTATSIF